MTFYTADQFPAPGLMIGNYNTAGGNLAPNGFIWDTSAGGLTALRDYVSGGGPEGALTKDALNPSNGSGGGLGRHTVTLTLNVVYSGIIPVYGSKPPWRSGFGNLTVHDTGGWADGKTVNQVLQAANLALATGTLPPGATSIHDVGAVVDALNKSFNNCHQSSWAGQYLQ